MENIGFGFLSKHYLCNHWCVLCTSTSSIWVFFYPFRFWLNAIESWSIPINSFCGTCILISHLIGFLQMIQALTIEFQSIPICRFLHLESRRNPRLWGVECKLRWRRTPEFRLPGWRISTDDSDPCPMLNPNQYPMKQTKRNTNWFTQIEV
jgi:hypothetical protein